MKLAGEMGGTLSGPVRPEQRAASRGLDLVEAAREILEGDRGCP
jgi:hypothetical protein